jgi:hypothetical protein
MIKKRATKKRVAKKSAVKKSMVKKKAARKRAVPTRAVAKKKVAKKKIPGYVKSGSGLFVPPELATVVPPSKLRKGFAKAKDEINGIIDEIIDTMTEDYVISEIEINASFSADGKFMGIGVGGAASIKIKVTPDRG